MKLNREIENKLLNAADVAEIIEICKSAGLEVSEAEAQQLLDKAADKKGSESNELSADELEAVTGGADRDWLTDGCAATVEPNSTCWSNDGCTYWDVTYDNGPADFFCVDCRHTYLYYFDWDGVYRRYKCPKCGALYKETFLELERVR